MYCGFCICPRRQDENTILLAGFYEITAWGIHFWGYVYISVSVYERERKRGELLKYLLRRQAIGLSDSEGFSGVRTHLSGPIDFSGLQFSTLDTWSPWLPPGSPDQFHPVPKQPTATSVLKSQPNFTFYHMCALSKALAVWTCFLICLMS